MAYGLAKHHKATHTIPTHMVTYTCIHALNLICSILVHTVISKYIWHATFGTLFA